MKLLFSKYDSTIWAMIDLFKSNSIIDLSDSCSTIKFDDSFRFETSRLKMLSMNLNLNSSRTRANKSSNMNLNLTSMRQLMSNAVESKFEQNWANWLDLV